MLPGDQILLEFLRTQQVENPVIFMLYKKESTGGESD